MTLTAFSLATADTDFRSRFETRLGRLVWRIGLAMVAISAFSCSPPPLQTATQIATNTPNATVTGTPESTPTPTETSTPSVRQLILDRLASADVMVTNTSPLSDEQLIEVEEAVKALSEAAAEIYETGEGLVLSNNDAFRRLFGPSEILAYTEAYYVDGVHGAVNCGWEGHYAEGCQYTSVYPDQRFPDNRWLIIIAGKRIPGSTSSEGRALVAHELAHNLTWGHGHLPSNVDGFSFVRYVGDEFAITYFDAFDIHAGIDTYETESDREANVRWRAELTADAIASWALGRIHGPFAESIGNYVRLSMLCELYSGPDC